MSTEDPAPARHGTSSGRTFTTSCRTPGQYLVEDFPVLSAGPTPDIDLEDWEFTITSETGEQRRWDWGGSRPCQASWSPSTSTA